MFKYFNLQLKRVFKFFPFVLSVTLILLVGVALILGSFLKTDSQKEENTRFRVALTGDTDNQYMQWGLAAMQTMDQSKFTIDLFEAEQKEAEKMLKRGAISAYLIIPDDFIENAMKGKIEPLGYVTTTGSVGIVSMFKNEITHLITDLLIYSEKGVYGIGEVLDNNGYEDVSGKYMDKLNLDYFNLILHRSDILDVTVLGLSNGVPTTEYYICGMTVLLLLLIGIPYATVHIKKDHALNRLLLSKGNSTLSQLFCEYLAHFVSLYLLSVIILAIFGGFLTATTSPDDASAINATAILSLTYKIIPVVIMVSAFNLMIFELSGNLVNGMLLHFFSALSLCYVSGCFFPIYSFPKIVQQLSVFLPTGVARGYLEGCIKENVVLFEFLGLAAFAAAFLAIALFVRRFKTVMKSQG